MQTFRGSNHRPVVYFDWSIFFMMLTIGLLISEAEFAKFTGKHLCQSLFFNKVAGLRPATLFKKRLWHRCFPVNFAKFLKTPFLTEHLLWLLL